METLFYLSAYSAALNIKRLVPAWDHHFLFNKQKDDDTNNNDGEVA